jgi:hypothetical protein
MSGYPIDLSRARTPAALLLGGSVVLAHLPTAVGLPCPLRSATGVPCPCCGLTTAWRDLGGGRVGSSLAAAPAGIVLAALALLLVVGIVPSRLSVKYWVVVMAVGTEWAYELVRFHLL